MNSFPLKPHPSQADLVSLRLKDFKLRAALSVQDHVLELKFHWQGDAGEILWPSMHSPVSRQDLLWEHTCFEAFWAWAGEECYWELNVSPSGDWNIYSFQAYRQGQKQEEKLVQLYFERHAQSLLIRVDLSRIQEPQRKQMILGLTAVIELKGGQKTYWALEHSSEQPDFHMRKSFIIQI